MVASGAALRHPEDVFAADSLATLRAAPVVDLHPAQPVTAENLKALSVGHVHDDVRADGALVAGTVTVNDAAEVALIEAKERRERLCGSTCTIEPGAGEYQGERYDQRQRDIRYNQVGLGPAGWGRAGSEVALRLDGAAVQVSVRDRAAGETMKKLKERGREFKLDVDEEVAAAPTGALPLGRGPPRGRYWTCRRPRERSGGGDRPAYRSGVLSVAFGSAPAPWCAAPTRRKPLFL